MSSDAEIIGEDEDGKPVIMLGIDHEVSDKVLRLDVDDTVIYLGVSEALNMAEVLARWVRKLIDGQMTKEDIQ